MKNVFLALVGVALAVTIALSIKPKQDYHYVLLQHNGTVVSGDRPLKFEDLEWKDISKGDIWLPFLDGYPVLCMIGDEKGAMYSYHPFSASNQKDFKHNAATIPIGELVDVLRHEYKIDPKLVQGYQSVVKIKRDLGGVGSVERGLIEGSLRLNGM